MHSGVIDTSLTGTVESLTPLCRYANFEKISMESLTPLCEYDTSVTFEIICVRLWLPLKGISIEKTYCT
jgi:hypothetical protein